VKQIKENATDNWIISAIILYINSNFTDTNLQLN